MIRETVYINRDNTIDLLVLADGAAIDGAVVTRTVLKLRDGSNPEVIIDSDSTPSVFDWSSGGGVLKMALGHQSLNPDRYSANLFIYDASHPNGLTWGEPFELTGINAG